MKAYKNYLIIIAVLAVIYLVLYLPGVFRDEQREEEIFPGFERSIADSVTISKNGKTEVKIVEEAGRWFVETADKKIPANKSRIENLFKAVEELSSVRKFSADDPGKYNLDPEKGILVEVGMKKGDNISFTVGKNTRDFVSTFFLAGEKKKVRVSPRSLIRYVTPTAATWYDKVIMQIDTADVTSLELPKVQLDKKDQVWVYRDTDKVRVDESKLYAYLNIYSRFRTNGYALEETLDGAGVSNGRPVITLIMGENRMEIIEGNTEDKTQYFGIRENGEFHPWVYTMSENRLRELLKGPQYFVQEEKDSSVIPEKKKD